MWKPANKITWANYRWAWITVHRWTLAHIPPYGWLLGALALPGSPLRRDLQALAADLDCLS